MDVPQYEGKHDDYSEVARFTKLEVEDVSVGRVVLRFAVGVVVVMFLFWLAIQMVSGRFG